MKRYSVKECFGPTLQGEGLHTGQACIFLRMASCNAWDGKQSTKATSACPYCDTDFNNGTLMTAQDIAGVLKQLSLAAPSPMLGLVITGGEPALQIDHELMAALCCMFAWIDVETNGTRPLRIPLSDKVYVICSPKKVQGEPIVLQQVAAWKLLIPHQLEFLPMALASNCPVYVQPVVMRTFDDDDYKQALALCTDLCFQYPKIRLSLQTHKILGLR